MRHYFPALRGRFGDWAYYSILMTVEQLVERVKFAEEIHNIRGSKKLSELIQRELSGRGPEIAKYLADNEDRFFNSIVVAVYGGSPEWSEFEIKPKNTIDAAELDITGRYSTGYLSFDNKEKLFALDGQHRLAGLREAVKANSSISTEELPVIVISHHNTKKGVKRTRKLFTTLNKMAKAVNKSEIIALDESDVAAIITRYLVEEDPKWSLPKLVDTLGKTANLPANNRENLTNIINLYDVIDLFLKKSEFSGDAKKYSAFKLNRPTDEKLKGLIECIQDFFNYLREGCPEFSLCFTEKNLSVLINKHRHNKGGHLLFRPVGLKISADVVGELRKTLDLKDAVKIISKIPTELSKEPYNGILWNKNGTMRVGGAALTRDLLLYMLGHYTKKTEQLHNKYAKVLELDAKDVELPKLVK